ncbi:MAG: transglycosylase domain-containing protein [Syntrophomonadaceae bacterium]
MVKKKTKKLNWQAFVKLVGILCLAGFLGGIGFFVVAAANLPPWDPQQLSGAKTTIVYDKNGEVATLLHAGQNRTEVDINQIPQDLINAVIAIEDNDFYKHHGITIKGIMRAVIRNIQSGDLTGQGASTITQQLAKNAFLSLDKRWERKAQEAILAFKLESIYSKDEILTMYLNIIPFGAGAYGVQAAANTYFGKDVSELSLAECSLLAGLPQSPNAYNPFNSLDKAKARQQAVLNNMVKCGFIDQTTATAAYNEPLNLNENYRVDRSKYGYYADAIIEEALAILEDLQVYDNPEDALYRSGLKIYTAMDKQTQAFAEEVFANPDNLPKQTNAAGEKVQAAMALVNVETGGVEAVIGGRVHERQRGFNRATDGKRQPGSSIKPISVYAPALEDGYMPFFVLDDSPISYKIGNSPVWTPENYDKQYRGLIPMRTAVEHSINTYAVQMLDTIGIRRSFDFAESLGLDLVDAPGTNDLGLSPLALGGLTRGVSPLEMASAYAAFANKGVYAKPYFISKIISEDGVELYSHKPVYTRVMSEQTAWLMSSMLNTVVNSGTGTRAKIPGVFTCGKTGTTENYNDSWFCGFTPTYAAAVWMGFDQNDTMRNYPPEYPSETAFGGNFPARIFQKVVQQAHGSVKPPNPTMPPDIVQIAVCSKSGKIASEICPEDSIVSEYCRKDCVPVDVCDRHEIVNICSESGKLAGRYCPHPQQQIMIRADENSYTPNKIPAETCDIHSQPSYLDFFDQFKDDPGDFFDDLFDRHKDDDKKNKEKDKNKNDKNGKNNNRTEEN